MARTLYDLLEVSPTASQEVIKNAYRALAAKLHPDTGGAANEESFKILGKAFAILSDPEKRKQYDSRMLHGEENIFLGLDNDEPSRRIETVKRRDGSDTWCTIDEHIRRNGSELSNANLRGLRLRNLKLDGANLSGCDLSNADIGSVSMTKANLAGCICQHSRFEKVDFTKAGFNNTDFSSCVFRDCVFDSTNIKNAKFKSCDFTGSTFKSANLVGLDFSNSVLQGVVFSGDEYNYNMEIYIDVSDCNFSGCNLESAAFGATMLINPDGKQKPLRPRSLKNNIFEKANMSNLNGEGCRFADCNFDFACLTNANFKSSSFISAPGFRNASLFGSDFSASKLQDLDFQTCNVVNARFHNANLKRVSFPYGFLPPPESIAVPAAPSDDNLVLGLAILFVIVAIIGVITAVATQ